MDTIGETINRHKKVALQFSGGKDSLAVLHKLQPHLHNITVYWLNAGDNYPETLQSIDYCKTIAPNFIEVTSDVKAQIEKFGIPSDVVPCSATAQGAAAEGGTTIIQSRYDCCARSIMLPLHHRMIVDGVTLIIRGQKNADRLKGTLRSGDVADGFEFLYPIEDWTDDEVMQYLDKLGCPIPGYYNQLRGAPDCMCCSAFWEEGRSNWLQRYPDKLSLYQQRLDIIRIAVSPHIAAFNREITP